MLMKYNMNYYIYKTAGQKFKYLYIVPIYIPIYIHIYIILISIYTPIYNTYIYAYI